MDVRRIASQQTAQEVGAEQVQALAEARQTCLEALDIVAADGKYGNVRFLSCVSGLRVGSVARLRSDRVFYRPAEPISGKRGRPPKYGKRFDLKDEQTWGEPDEVQEFEDEHYGKVRLKRWNGLRDKRAANLTFDLICAATHLEKDKPPAAVWFAWLPPVHLLAQIAITAPPDPLPHWGRGHAGMRFRKGIGTRPMPTRLCPASRTPRRAISGRNWSPWHIGSSSWRVRWCRTTPCPGKKPKPA
ncbi:MAG: transposase [Anaerolineae bacterium]